MKIIAIDRTFARAIAQEALVALRPIAEKYGLTVAEKGGSFSKTSTTARFEFATVSKDGAVQDREAESFKLFASLYGLAPTDLSRVITVAGNDYKITGLVRRRAQYPISVSRVKDGKGFKFPIGVVREAIGAARAAG